MKLIRKLSIGRDYKNDAMHYATGQEVYGGHKIHSISDQECCYDIYIEKDNEILPWKSINKNMAVVVEYDLNY